jgi:hypothetical protein
MYSVELQPYFMHTPRDQLADLWGMGATAPQSIGAAFGKDLRVSRTRATKFLTGVTISDQKLEELVLIFTPPSIAQPAD